MRGKEFTLVDSFVECRITPAYAGKSSHTVKEIGITPAYAGKSLCDQLGVQVRRDHPRLCGEKKHRTYIDSKVKGSPPPMRGKASGFRPLLPVTRITPAYAGKRYKPEKRQGCRQDHPRLCGEKRFAFQSRTQLRGSPPPMRGKVITTFGLPLSYRITPAYAGKSYRKPQILRMWQDHPRLCGEKKSQRRNKINFKGSPPPMRGKVMMRIPEGANVGITPAYAGKRDCGIFRCRCIWDHPRLCGEKATRQQRKVKKIGSPPPMQGKVKCACKEWNRPRITPAYAGKSNYDVAKINDGGDHPRLCGEKAVLQTTFSHTHRITPAYAGKSPACHKHCHCDGDHPRLCGEKLEKHGRKITNLGSPPPMRGKGGVKVLSATERRITPAYAGKRSSILCTSCNRKDHPRLCGEKRKSPKLRHFHRGSPPPMRGKASSCILHSATVRITPAYAGKRL